MIGVINLQSRSQRVNLDFSRRIQKPEEDTRRDQDGTSQPTSRLMQRREWRVEVRFLAFFTHSWRKFEWRSHHISYFILCGWKLRKNQIPWIVGFDERPCTIKGGTTKSSGSPNLHFTGITPYSLSTTLKPLRSTNTRNSVPQKHCLVSQTDYLDSTGL